MRQASNSSYTPRSRTEPDLNQPHLSHVLDCPRKGKNSPEPIDHDRLRAKVGRATAWAKEPEASSAGEGIPEHDDLDTLASGPSDRIPSELAEGTTLTLDEPEEDIRPDQEGEGSGRRGTAKSRDESKGGSKAQYDKAISSIYVETVIKPVFFGGVMNEKVVAESVEKLGKVLDVYEARLSKS
ncbi:hypothetical protein B296_00038985, partial [Ensete ventricosum]